MTSGTGNTGEEWLNNFGFETILILLMLIDLNFSSYIAA